MDLPPAATGAPAPGHPAAGTAPLSWLVAGPLAAAAGSSLALALPGTGWWPLAPLGVAGLAVAVRHRRPGAATLLGLVAGWGYFLPALHWSGVYVGALPWLALATLEALFVALMTLLLASAWRAPGGPAGTALAVSGLWVAQEALRGRVPFGGFPWARLAFSQADAPTLGLAAIGGAPLVTAAVALAGGLLAVSWVGLVEGRRWSAGGAAAAAVAILLSGGLVPGVGPTGRSLQVAAIQGNVPAAGLDFNAERRAVLDNHVRVTRGLAEQVAAGTATRPDLVVWPENASDIDPLRNPDAGTVISAVVDAIGVQTLVGTVLDTPPGRLSNASIVWTPGQGPGRDPSQLYVKRHPAPFGEYIPNRSFFRRFSDQVDLVRRDFVSGDRVGVLSAGGTTIGDVICFEVAYDNLVRDTVRGGAQLLVVQTNNATFGYTDESIQQLAMSRLRAVESGRAVVHISTVGVSALILPDGSLRQRTELFTSAVLTGALPLSSARTPATRVGQWPELLLAVCGVLLALTGSRRRTGRR